jgi:inner membrane protein
MPISHSLVGMSLVATLRPRPFKRRWLPLVVGAALANSPDLDFLLNIATHTRGWHRGFTHSLGFAVVVALCLLIALGWRRRWEAFAYGLAFASHGVLDFATTKIGAGVEILWPFTSEKYGFVC